MLSSGAGLDMREEDGGEGRGQGECNARGSSYMCVKTSPRGIEAILGMSLIKLCIDDRFNASEILGRFAVPASHVCHKKGGRAEVSPKPLNSR